MEEIEIRSIAGQRYDGIRQLSYGELTDIIADGLKAGISMYAWWKDGEQFVGTTGRTLKNAIRDVDDAVIKVQTNR